MYPVRHHDHGYLHRPGPSLSATPVRLQDEWVEGGLHHTVEEFVHGGPGAAGYAKIRTVQGPTRGSTTRATGGSAGVLSGLALNLLDGLIGRRPPRGNGREAVQGKRRSISSSEEETESDDSDGLAYGDEDEDDEDDDDDEDDHGSTRQRRSVFTHMKDAKQRAGSFLENRSRRASQPWTQHQHRDHPSSSRRRPSIQRTHSAYETEEREPGWATSRRARIIEIEKEEEGPKTFHVNRQPRRLGRDQVDSRKIQQLEGFIDAQRRKSETCRVRLEQAARQPTVTASDLHHLVNELQTHEKLLRQASHDLNETRKRQRASRSPQRSTKHRRGESSGQQHPYESRARDISPEMERERRGHVESRRPRSGPRQTWDSKRPPPRPRSRSFQTEHIFPEPYAFLHRGRNAFPFDDMFGPDHVFEHFFDFPPQPLGGGFHARAHFNVRPDTAHTFRATFGFPDSTPPKSRPHDHRTSSGGGYTYMRNPPPPPPRSQPVPSTLLKPEEAKHLFSQYNARWAALAPNDANIPWPARGFAADALRSHDTLWAPHVGAPVATWSEENIMQANAQAFYLGVVGLTPQYAENPATARLQMGFDKSRASAAQIKELTDILKKEKARWHSDRLGRRSAGQPGVVNEALQKDERARAVFHAVCELMDTAQA